MPEPPRHVFVYGTLRRGGRNDINRLAPAPRYVGMGEVRGHLYHFDWYPGLTLGGDQAVTVVGEANSKSRWEARPLRVFSTRSIPRECRARGVSGTATGSCFVHREIDFAFRNSMMLRRAKFSQYKKLFST